MGQKYAAYDSTGAIVAFYDSVDSPAPSGVTAIKITDTDWQACINATDRKYTVANGVLTAPTAKTDAELVAEAQAAQKAIIDAAYAAAVTTDVSFTCASGVTKTYQADPDSQTLVTQATQGYEIAGATPAGFYWVAADNTHVPFTLADLQGLYTAILSQGWAAFQKRQTKKASILAATTVAAVQAVTWS